MARSTVWVDNVLEATVVASQRTDVNLLTALDAFDVVGMTLIRLIYRIQFYPVSPFIVDTIQGIHMGIGVVDNTAFIAGGASLPDPGVSAEAPSRGWVVRDQDLTVSTVADGGTTKIGELRGDIRAMRKFYQNATLWLAMRSDTEVGTAQTVNVFAIIRALFKNQ